MNRKIIFRILKYFGAGYILEKLNLRVIRADRIYARLFEPRLDYPVSPLVKESLIRAISEEIGAGLETIGPVGRSPSLADLADQINHCLEVARSCPYRNNTGGSHVNHWIWLYVIIRRLSPTLFVESGVWKGHTAWFIEQATSGELDYIGFDISLNYIEHRGPQYEETDWTKHHFRREDAKDALVFFDCHVNHARRIIEAAERGFTHVLFDDNPRIHQLFAFGKPGAPTANMLWHDDLARVADGETLQWTFDGRHCKFTYDRAEAERARALIEHHVALPDLTHATRYGRDTFLSYVRLKRDV